MENLNQKKKKIKTIIKIVSFIFIILVILLIYFNSDLYKNRNIKGNLGVYIPEDYEDPSINEVRFTNIEALKNFEGYMPVSTGIAELKKIFNQNLPRVIEETKNMNENELKEYYETNRGVLKSQIKIDSEESFLNMVAKYKDITDSLRSGLKTCEITESGTIKLLLIYSNGQQVSCQMTGTYITNFILVF